MRQRDLLHKCIFCNILLQFFCNPKTYSYLLSCIIRASLQKKVNELHNSYHKRAKKQKKKTKKRREKCVKEREKGNGFCGCNLQNVYIKEFLYLSEVKFCFYFPLFFFFVVVFFHLDFAFIFHFSFYFFIQF